MRGNLAALLCLMLAACAVQETDEHAGEVSARALASGLQCGKGKGVTIVELDSSEELDARHSALLPGDLASTLNSERVFVISMGLYPTAGHSLSLAQKRARLEHGVVTIPVVWHEPAPGAITAQVITQPCLIVALEKRQYTGVRVVDQNGVERAAWNK
jgi:PrcB C-terminal